MVTITTDDIPLKQTPPRMWPIEKRGDGMITMATEVRWGLKNDVEKLLAFLEVVREGELWRWLNKCESFDDYLEMCEINESIVDLYKHAVNEIRNNDQPAQEGNMAQQNKPRSFMPETPAGSMLAHLEADTEEKAWANLLGEASHMPYDGIDGFKARGYKVFEYSDDDGEQT